MIPGLGMKIPHATQCGYHKEKKNIDHLQMLAAGHKGGRVRETVESSSSFWGNKDYMFHVLIGFLFLFLFLAASGSLQDLGSPTRDRTCALRNEGTKSWTI